MQTKGRLGGVGWRVDDQGEEIKTSTSGYDTIFSGKLKVLSVHRNGEVAPMGISHALTFFLLAQAEGMSRGA